MTVRQIGEMRPLQEQERSMQNEKCGRCESREDFPLKTHCFPKDVAIAERVEPEHVHVVRQSGPTTEEDYGKNDQNENETAATRLRWAHPGPVNGLGHCSPFYASLHSVIRMILPPFPKVAR